MFKKNSLFFLLISFGYLSSFAQNRTSDKLFVVDTIESEVEWFCGRHYGCVQLDTGMVNFEKNILSGGNFIIDLNTLHDDDFVDNKLLRLTLNNVIKSRPFFNVETYPYAVFTIEDVYKLDSVKYWVSGSLEIMEEVRCVEVICEIKVDEGYLSVYSDIITIDRTNWGVNYLSEKFDPEGKENMYVPDSISFLIHLFAKEIDKKSLIKKKK